MKLTNLIPSRGSYRLLSMAMMINPLSTGSQQKSTHYNSVTMRQEITATGTHR